MDKNPSDRKSIDDTDVHLAGFANPAARLREALDKDEFTLYCQPILALQGAERYPLGEVLVRLREEERAMLPPGEFLPVLEHYKMMPELDRWVLKNVAKRLAAGCRMARLTMNVSHQTLEDKEFPKVVEGAIKASGLAAGAVVFEIEENDLLNRAALVGPFAAGIKAAGGAVLIDGFGRKAVSFAPLKNSGAAFVKVDGSIVRKLLTSEVARTKLGAIQQVGKAIGLTVIAECVEEQDILLRLKAMGVEYAQGFGILQPQQLDNFAAK